MLVHKNLYFLKTHKSGRTLDPTHFTSMATGQNSSSVVALHSSSGLYKIATTVLPRRGYPELPDLSDNPPSLTLLILR